MAKIISHRGNLSGPKTAPSGENSGHAIKHAIAEGFDVEVDIQDFDGYNFITGHDEADHVVDSQKLDINRVWFHAKSIYIFEKMLNHTTKFNVFYHTNEDVVLTSKGNLWFFPKAIIPFHSNNVMVLPEAFWFRKRESGSYWNMSSDLKLMMQQLHGVCTDYPYDFYEFFGGK